MKNLRIILLTLLTISCACSQDNSNNTTNLDTQIQNQNDSSSASINISIAIQQKLHIITERLNRIDEMYLKLKSNIKKENLIQKSKMSEFDVNITIIRKKESNIKSYIDSLKQAMNKLKMLMRTTHNNTEFTLYYHARDKVINDIFNLKQAYLKLQINEQVLNTKKHLTYSKFEKNKRSIKNRRIKLNLRKLYLINIQKRLLNKQKKITIGYLFDHPN